jgi:hypothetical protein
MSDEMFKLFKQYAEERPVAIRAAAPLKDGAVVGLKVLEEDEHYHFIREKGKSYLRKGKIKDTDFDLIVPKKELMEIIELDTDSIGKIGVEIFKRMKAEGAKTVINAGFISLTRKGYFGVLKLGGAEVMKHLAADGISFTKLASVISSMKKQK